MNVLQINLHKSKVASANLLVHLAKGGADVVLIQEPWISDNRICGIRTADYNLLYKAGEGKPRSCVLIKKIYNAYLLTNFSDRDTTAVCLETGRGSNLWLVAAYMPHDVAPPPPVLRELLTEARSSCAGVAFGADANAHHTIWGSTDVNERGELLLDYIINENIVICNRGNEPTFVVTTRREVLDITLTNLLEDDFIGNWKVLEENSFSDHRYIQLTVCLDSGNQTVPVFRNYRKTDWHKFGETLRSLLQACRSHLP